MTEESKISIDSPMYLFATEMVSLYYKKLDVNNKSVLTVIGSGDQVLNAIYYGATNVWGFDINENAIFLTHLKITGIKILSYEEYLEFFSYSDDSFDEMIYRKLQNDLPEACRVFFDRLYATGAKKGLGATESFRKRSFAHSPSKIQEINEFMKGSDAYISMRKKLERSSLNMFLCDATVLNENLQLVSEKFDIINLSNIPNYFSGHNFKYSDKEIISYLEKTGLLLSETGTMFYVSYDDSMYPTPMAPSIPSASRQSFLEMLEKMEGFSVRQEFFTGFISKQDRITILERSV